MKELSIEEKAKAYDEAIKKAKDMLSYKEVRREDMEHLFPELKESEDERIREYLIRYIDNTMKSSELKNKLLAWLEKQGSLKDIVNRYKDSWYNEGKIAGMAEGLTDDEKYQQGWHDALEKQDRQKLIEWSEEDEKGLGDALWCCKQAASIAKDENDMGNVWYAENWLKSRYPQKQCMITEEELSAAKKEAYNDALNKIEYSSSEPTFDDGWSAAIWYLKKRNALPQNTWKPSDEQITVLELACKYERVFTPKQIDILIGLKEQLKKLKGE